MDKNKKIIIGFDAYNHKITGDVGMGLTAYMADPHHICCVLTILGHKSMNYAMQSFGEYKEAEKGSALKQRDYKDAADLAVKEKTVRRLTPLECERLQGYPDGWTDIGEWTDSKGKVHKESSDSARYRALGNSICLPFWKVLAKRISAQYDRDITMGSLFDGIGGFPYVFEQINGKGTARWASEIEEFPIAVTKRHFPERSD